jgi:hypothetical protein
MNKLIIITVSLLIILAIFLTSWPFLCRGVYSHELSVINGRYYLKTTEIIRDTGGVKSGISSTCELYLSTESNLLPGPNNTSIPATIKNIDAIQVGQAELLEFMRAELSLSQNTKK